MVGMMLVCTGLYAQNKNDAAAQGKEVFTEYCHACHGQELGGAIGPSLKDLFKRGKLKNGMPMTEASVRAQIDEGGNGMPAHKDILSGSEKNALIAYLRTL